MLDSNLHADVPDLKKKGRSTYNLSCSCTKYLFILFIRKHIQVSRYTHYYFFITTEYFNITKLSLNISKITISSIHWGLHFLIKKIYYIILYYISWNRSGSCSWSWNRNRSGSWNRSGDRSWSCSWSWNRSGSWSWMYPESLPSRTIYSNPPSNT